MTPRWSPNPRSLHSRQELLARGVHQRRLASPEFTDVIPGFCTPSAAPAELRLIARVLQRKVAPDVAISHVTAAELLELPLPFRFEYAKNGQLHCSVPLEKRRRLGARVTVHTRNGSATSHARGVELSSPITLLCELATMLDHGDLVACCDHLVGRDAVLRPRPTLQRLREHADEATGLHGIKRARKALADARERVESPKETEMRLLLLRAGFGEPVVNHEIRAPGTGERFRLDLSNPELRIAIEYDGFWHSTDKKRHRADRRKDDVLHELGWRVVRVADRDLWNPTNFLGRLVHVGAPLRRRSRAR